MNRSPDKPVNFLKKLDQAVYSLLSRKPFMIFVFLIVIGVTWIFTVVLAERIGYRLTVPAVFGLLPILLLHFYRGTKIVDSDSDRSVWLLAAAIVLYLIMLAFLIQILLLAF